MLKPLAVMALSEATGAIRRRAVAAGYYAAGGVCALIAVVFALLALHDWLTPLYLGPIAAKLAISGGLLAIAAILALIGGAAARRKADSGATSPAGIAAALAAAAPAAVSGASRAGLGAVAAGAALIAATYVGRRLGRG